MLEVLKDFRHERNSSFVPLTYVASSINSLLFPRLTTVPAMVLGEGTVARNFAVNCGL